MPLRDFDQVRERIQLRVEVRHIAQGVVLLLVLVSAAFGVGVWYARQQPSTEPIAAPVMRTTAANGAPSAEAAAEAVTPVAEAPIVPKPVALAAVDAGPVAQEPEPPAVVEAPAAAEAVSPERVSELLATAPDERAVPPAEVGMSPAPFAAQESAKATPPTPEPPQPALTPARPDADTKAAVAAAPIPAPVAVVAAPPPPASAKVAAPHGLGLFGTLRMAPTLVSAAPVAPHPEVVAPVEDKSHVTQVHKIVVRPREDDVRPPPVSGHYVIQVKAFRDEVEAKAFEADLRGKGHAPKLTSIEVPDKGTFYRVRLGPFDSLEAARAAQKQFETAEGHVTILLAVP